MCVCVCVCVCVCACVRVVVFMGVSMSSEQYKGVPDRREGGRERDCIHGIHTDRRPWSCDLIMSGETIFNGLNTNILLCHPSLIHN